MSLTGTTPEVATSTTATDTAKVEEKLRIEGRARSGASWFYWLAGLSMVNAIIVATGSDWNFIFGLGITQMFSAVGKDAGSGGNVVALIVAAIVAGIFVFLGVFAHRRAKWAFITGMGLYTVDGLLCMLAGVWLMVAVHGLVLYWIWGGWTATKQLVAMESEVAGLAPPLMK